MTILSQILQDKFAEVQASKVHTPLQELMDKDLFARKIISAKKSLAEKSVIAEFKRKSPSKGFFNQQADAKSICLGYEQAGAGAVSVLTDSKYFGGSLQDLMSVRSVLNIPVLRKDFIVDEYQIYESKACGADLILLIAAALKPEVCQSFAQLAKELGLEVLLEVHSLQELQDYPTKYVDLIGVNNRDLKSFNTDINLSKNLFNFLPQDCLPVSESGIDDPLKVKELQKVGYRAFLIGENFMKKSDPVGACQEFIEQIR